MDFKGKHEFIVFFISQHSQPAGMESHRVVLSPIKANETYTTCWTTGIAILLLVNVTIIMRWYSRIWGKPKSLLLLFLWNKTEWMAWNGMARVAGWMMENKRMTVHTFLFLMEFIMDLLVRVRWNTYNNEQCIRFARQWVVGCNRCKGCRNNVINY